MGSLIYVAAIIIIAIISSLNKTGKNKGNTAPRGGMPTFGGGDGNPLHPARRAKRQPDRERNAREGSGFPVPGGASPSPERPAEAMPEVRNDASPAWPGSSAPPAPDYETGEGLSLEQGWEEDGVQARTERLQKDLERLQSQFEGTSAGMASADTGNSPDSGVPVPAGRREFAAGRKELRDGLLWAEILGPPRSRQPRSFRR
ncbi:hypothetical protein [Paenibacillus sp. S150]|uniref:hypothetical protein n=1 Tax=Paenibacillus sp. S150 TaxID=2749826 RepID=UPI001C563A02|nr:hypothetical protein [Paenibacillus sp. S150]MBW4080138.1 hypothetical protein [Paenibacillus sp. S150]